MAIYAFAWLNHAATWPHASPVHNDIWSKVKEAGALITTIVLAIMVGAWLIAVALQLGQPVVYDNSGKITLDTFTRAKDVLTLLLPFLTIAVGFWLGTQGTAQIERQVARATLEAEVAHGAARAAEQTAAENLVRASELEGQVEFWRYRAATAEQRVETLENELGEARLALARAAAGDFEPANALLGARDSATTRPVVAGGDEEFGDVPLPRQPSDPQRPR